MKRISLFLISILFLSACGSATFETASTGNGDPGLTDGGGDDNNNDMDNNPSPEKIPLRDAIDNPALLDQFACIAGDYSSVEICHFPEGSGNYHTICIGRPAVDTHYDHFYPETDDFDYLGKCKP